MSSCRYAYATPVRSSVFEAGPPQDQGGVAVGHLLQRDGGALSELLLLEIVLAGAAVPLKLVQQRILSEPLDGLVLAGPEVTGESAVL